MTEILEMLERDASLSAAEIAARLKMTEEAVAAEIARMKGDGTILKYAAVVDWDKMRNGGGGVSALIDLKISPQRGEGYDRIAERICQFEQVESLYLTSGTHDLTVTIRARDMREVSEFVYEHLAAIDGVVSTETRFIMRKYKEKYCVFHKEQAQQERGLFV